MAPTPPSKYDYDFLVIGGGSGGMGASRRAGQYGKKVAVVEGSGVLGGTCVNVGCVPKKVMWYTADIAEKLKAAKEYGFELDEKSVKFNWGEIKKRRDAYVHRLNGIYEKNLQNDKVDYIKGRARFGGPNELIVQEPDGNERKVTAEYICIAVGGRPSAIKDVEGSEYGIDSDGFFRLEELPKKVVVVGAGYIAVELAGIFHTLGAETHIMIRHDNFLRTFDPIIYETLIKHMEHTGIHVHRKTNVKKVESDTPIDKVNHAKPFPMTVHTDSGKKLENVETLLWAIGRTPETDTLGLDKVPKIELDKKGQIKVDEWQTTGYPNIFAIGDVQGKLPLTPVAIATGRKLSNRLFGGEQGKKLGTKMDFNNVASAIFSHPTCGSVGLTEAEAREQYGDKVKVYKSNFTAMYYSVFEKQEDKEPTAYKVICVGEDEKVVGIHIIGLGSDEIIQLAPAVILGGHNKAFLDSITAVHPTSAEELVTLR